MRLRILLSLAAAAAIVPTPDQTPKLRNRRVHIVNPGAYANALK